MSTVVGAERKTREPIEAEDALKYVQDHLETLIPLLRKIRSGGSSTIEGDGFVAWNGPGEEEHLTELGWEIVIAAQRVAEVSWQHLWEVVENNQISGGPIESLVSETRLLMAVTTTALKGLDRDGSVVPAPHVTGGLAEAAIALLRRAQETEDAP